MNYYPFHVGDYVSATRHLSWDEDAAYRRMLDVYYTTEKPLPTEIRAVCRLVMATTESQREAVQVVLEEFFVLTPAGWINPRADEEIDAMCSKQQVQREKANKRWHKPKEDSSNAAASNRDAVAMPPTEAIASGGKPPDKPPMTADEIIYGYGVPMLTGAGIAEKQARSFLGGLRKEHGDRPVIDKLRDCIRAKPLQPLEWLAAALPPGGGKRAGKQAQIESRNAAVVADWQPPEIREGAA